ncbi:MAG: asparagine--tRNA ligase [Acidobacteria bacterium]|uniref:Asparagine--tRNA ligase n=1 Tax=Candidatus Polarisedimenticola svalbardensis TaxID=2886004 RepID=A0A8J6Y099_9BACT|nr:asparagine--tRNA ligase [Candidatus Polarisedimenticola svalbardensis]
MSRSFVYIEELSKHVGESVTLKGWLFQKRSSGKIKFLVLRDGTGYLQCVAFVKNVSAELFEACDRVPLESSIAIRGTVKEDDRAPGGFELALEELEIIHEAGEFPIQPKEHGIEFLFDKRHLYMRSRTPQAVLRVRNEVVKACRDFFYDLGYVLVDSPILTPAACEGTSTLFETDYFGQPAYLTQSGQLYLEPACMAFGRVFCLGPTFRAEKSKTRRHLTEFWMIEPEVAFMELPELLELAESFVTYVVGRALERCGESLKVLERDTAKLEAIQAPFPRLTYEQAADILMEPESQARMKEAGAPEFQRGNDFGGMDETLLTERFDRPVMVTHWPREIKAFYMQPDADDPSKAACVDILAPEGYGEIIGGSQRIHDHDLLLSRIREHDLPEEAFQWYLDIRKYGTVPHSGFGMGIERCVAWICGIPHVRETIPYPRQIHRIYP